MSVNNISIKPKHANKQSIRWDYFSGISGAVGLIMAFIPYLSLFGVLSSTIAVGFSILAFQKKQKSPWVWLGLITSSLTLLALFIVLGLVIFF